MPGVFGGWPWLMNPGKVCHDVLTVWVTGYPPGGWPWLANPGKGSHDVLTVWVTGYPPSYRLPGALLFLGAWTEAVVAITACWFAILRRRLGMTYPAAVGLGSFARICTLVISGASWLQVEGAETHR